MADIDLVIKIPEEEYEIIKNSTAPMTWAEHLIKNGTPLPKGHGRLGDLDALRKKVSSFIDAINDADTILDVDKKNIKKNDGSCNTCEYKNTSAPECRSCGIYDEWDNLITLSNYKKEGEEEEED
jgi:hypothetical protein